MKKLLYILAIVSLMSSCEKNVPDYNYDSGSFVAFQVKEAQDKESVAEIKVPVILADNGRTEQVTVDFAFDETYVDTTMISAVLGTDYILKNESNTLTFEPGVGIAYIIIEPVDNIYPQKNKVLKITLTSDSKNYTIGMPGPDHLNSSCLVVLQEDDCPLIEGVFEGKVNGAETTPWWTDETGNYEWTFDEEIEPGKVQYLVTGWFYAQLLTAYSAWYTDPADITFLPVRVIIDVTNPADPRYSMFDDLAFEDYTGWGWRIKPVDNQPLNIDVCGKYVEIPYTLQTDNWVENTVWTVKFQF